MIEREQPTEFLSEEGLELLVEEYLLAVSEGQPAELEQFEARIGEPRARSRFRSQALADEFLWRASGEEDVSAEEYLRKLETDEQRAHFQQVVEDSRRAGLVLPGSLTPGTLLAERYLIRGEIGRGGMGIVYAATDRELERQVALKVFNFQAPAIRAGDWEQMVREESQALAALRSRHIVTVYDARREGEHSFIVMDLVPGSNLQQVIHWARRLHEDRGNGSGVKKPSMRKDGELLRAAIDRAPEGEQELLIDGKSWYRSVSRIVGCVAGTVHLAHEQGLVHRDIKPSNVLLLGSGEPVLLDFGLAAGSAPEVVQEETGFRGTPEYLAPEQAKSWSTGTDPRTDIYQLGLVLYELLTLRQAFARGPDGNLLELLERVSAGEYVAPREVDHTVPHALEAICARALAVDPAQRYGSAGEMRTDLERFARGLPPRHVSIGLGNGLGMRAGYLGRNPVTWTALAAAAVLAGVVGLREERWSPPALSAFQQVAGAPEPTALAGSEVLAFEDVFALGVTASASSPSYLYVFSVFGGEEPEDRFLRPVAPERYGEIAGEDVPPRPIRVEEGESHVVCSYVMEAAYEYEGLLVYAAEEENDDLERWQQTLYELEKDNLAPVSFPRAMEMGRRELGQPRGQSGARLTAEERMRLFGNVQAAELESEDDWKALGIKRFERTFEVVD